VFRKRIEKMQLDPKNELSEELRQTMRLWATGVTVVTTQSGQRRSGMTVSAFTSVSLEPPLVLVLLQKESVTCRLIRKSRIFAVSILGEGQEAISRQFAGLTALPEGADRFNGVRFVSRSTGSPVLADAIAWMDCRVLRVIDAGTHYMISGQVLATGRKEPRTRPLVYHNRKYWRLARSAESEE